MTLPDPKVTGAPADADDLLAHITIATRAMRGLADDAAVYRAAMDALSPTRYPAFVLTLTDDRKRLRPAATSMSEIQVRAMETFVGVPLPRMRRRLDEAPIVSKVLAGPSSQCIPFGDLCRELFERDVAGKLTTLLGGGRGWSITTPLRCGDRLPGLLGLLTEKADAAEMAAAAQLSESLCTALIMAEILRSVQRARGVLPADHPAQQALRTVLGTAGQPKPDPNRSPIPWGRAVSEGKRSNTAPRARVLLVEDEERLRKTTTEILVGLGYDVEGVASGEHAIATYTRAREQRQPFGVVLMDQTLAGRMGGVETLRIIRSLDPNVRAILLSGQANNRNCEQMRKHGFQDCLPKPVSIEGLNAAIEQALQPVG